jgi:hypothetical protein
VLAPNPGGASPKQVVAAPVTAELLQVRAATHRGCDRVVFDLNGLGRVGYLVGYVPVVHADPSDRPVPVAGAGALQVTIGAPDFRESGHQATSPTRLSMVTDWSPLADGGGELQRRVGRLNARSCCCRSRDWAEQASRACYPRHQDGEG